MSERFIFLGGHRKCGTTMLLNLFDGHPRCLVYPTDLAVLYAYHPMYIDSDHSNDERIERLERVIFRNLEKIRSKHVLNDQLPVDRMREHFFDALGQERLQDVAAIVKQMIASYRFATGQSVDEKPVVIVKETSVEIHARVLAESFPDARFIPLVRDPRDNLGALRAGVEKHYAALGESERQLLASLLHRVGLGYRLDPFNEAALGAERFQPLSFERLAASPEEVMREVAAFIGIGFDADILSRPTVLGVPTLGNNYDGERFAAVTARNVGRWRERIGDFEAKVIEFHLGDLMEARGYARAFPPLEAALAAAEFYNWANTYYYFKDSFAK